MNRKMRVGWWFRVMGIMCLGLTLGMTCKKKNQLPITFRATFGGTGGDVGQSAQQTSDGGYIVTGHTSSYGAGGDDVWLIRTDSSGSKVWDKTFGGADDEVSSSVWQTSDGGYIITGCTFSSSTLNGDVLLVKTDAYGNEVWDRTFGGAHYEQGNSVQQTSDGGYIITGYTMSYGAGMADVWLIKTDSSGNEVWNKTFGGAGDDFGNSVRQTSDSGYIIAGYTSSHGTGGDDIWLIKTDSSGNQVWDKVFAGSCADGAWSVQQTSDGGYILTGYTSSQGADSEDVWLIKTDASGNKAWDKTFGGTGEDEGYSVQQTSDGGYIITGSTTSYGAGGEDVWLIKTDWAGNKVWDKTFGGTGDERGQSVQQASDGGYMVAGWTSSYGAGNYDVLLIKTDADGN